MNKRRISVCVLGLALATALFGRDEYTRRFDRTVPWSDGKKVYLEHKLGDVAIRTHAGGDVIIHADIKVSAGDGNQAKDFANRIEILVEPSSSELGIRTRYPEMHSAGFWPKNISYTVHYDVTIPETTALEVRNSFGSVSVTGVKASSEISDSHGQVEWRDGAGTQHLKTSFGNVQVTGNSGDVWVEAGNGSVTASEVMGKLDVRDRFGAVNVDRITKGVSVVNSNGSVQVSESGGLGEVQNSFGNVTVHGFKGDLKVSNTNGRVEALHVEGAAELDTTFGEVRFEDVGKKLTIHAGNSGVSGEHVGGALAIENSFGSVKVGDVQGGVDIHSRNGAVWLAKVRGEANVKTSFAAVEARDIGGALNVEDANGAVTASNARGAQVTTSFASVMLDEMAGPVRIINQNGAVEAASSLEGTCQPIVIRTSFSTLRVHLQSGASYHVAAKTSFGSIRSDFPLRVSGSMSNDNLDGVIGSGHCEMTLTDSNGAIEILKAGA